MEWCAPTPVRGSPSGSSRKPVVGRRCRRRRLLRTSLPPTSTDEASALEGTWPTATVSEAGIETTPRKAGLEKWIEPLQALPAGNPPPDSNVFILAIGAGKWDLYLGAGWWCRLADRLRRPLRGGRGHGHVSHEAIPTRTAGPWTATGSRSHGSTRPIRVTRASRKRCSSGRSK